MCRTWAVLVVVAVGVQLPEHQHPVGALPVLQSVRARLDRSAEWVDEPVQWRGSQRDVRGPRPARCAPAELVGDDSPGAVQPVAQAGDAGGVAARCERRPERGAGERRLDVSEQFVDRVLMLGLLGPELAPQPLQRVAQVLLAHLQFGVGEARTHRVGEAVVVVAHDPRGGAPSTALRNASQSAWDVDVNASRRHRFGAPAHTPWQPRPRNAIRWRPRSGSRTRNGNSSSSSDPAGRPRTLAGRARTRPARTPPPSPSPATRAARTAAPARADPQPLRPRSRATSAASRYVEPAPTATNASAIPAGDELVAARRVRPLVQADSPARTTRRRRSTTPRAAAPR